MNDKEIIRKLAEKDEEGLTLLMDQYINYVTAILCNISNGILTTEDVEELSSDVFLSIWNNGSHLNEDWPLKPYLAQTARNTAISRLRKIKNVPLSFDDDVIVLSKEGNPDEITIRNEQNAIINSAVRDLDEPDREIFVRFYFMGEHIDTISKRLVITPAAIKTKLHRCRKRLKSIFEERGYQCE